MTRLFALFACTALAACASRPLTENEQAFISTVQGDAINVDRVNIVEGAVVGLLSVTRPARPQVACRERLFPPETGMVTGSFAAFVLDETVHYSRWAYEDDFLEDYPDQLALRDAMRLAHELTHVWQWQQRETTGYHPLRAFREQVTSLDPYLFDIDAEARFLDYAYEQQGIIVEEFVCCRALDPEGSRTKRLTDLVGQVFPTAATRSRTPETGVKLPWDGAETQGICS